MDDVLGEALRVVAPCVEVRVTTGERRLVENEAPVLITISDALCAFGVSRHWPEGAASFTTVEAKANFLGSAKEGEVVIGTASPVHLGRTTQVWDATVANESTGRPMAAYRCTQL